MKLGLKSFASKRSAFSVFQQALDAFVVIGLQKIENLVDVLLADVDVALLELGNHALVASNEASDA